MVALFNGVGGGAAALIAVAELHEVPASVDTLEARTAIGILFSAIVGSVSFAGSLVAFGKLQEILPGRPITWPGQKVINGAGGAGGARGGGLRGGRRPQRGRCSWRSSCCRCCWASRPCCRSAARTCRSSSRCSTPSPGLAAASTGFVLHNDALIIAGTLVGASGTLLTQLMARAMNRLARATSCSARSAAPCAGPRRAGDGAAAARARDVADELAALLAYARRVVIVPGYGLAVAQAQHAVRELADHAREAPRGRQVRHPPGRRPHAGAHERAAGRGGRAVPAALGDGADQPGVRRARTSCW